MPLSEAGALGATFGTLAVFLIGTVIYALKNKGYDHDNYMSARNTQGALALSLSFFTSGAGAWMLFTLPEAAILGGPIAIIGYWLGCVIPLGIFACVAKPLREAFPHGITFFEFLQARYGTPVNAYVTLVAIFYMFLYLAAELTSVGSCVTLFATGLKSPLGPIIGMSLVTLFYSALGGLPVSLITDRVQGVGVIVFAVLVCIAAAVQFGAPTSTDGAVKNGQWAMATGLGLNNNVGDSFSMAVILIMAVTSAQLLHTGFQQRIWAAHDVNAVVKGLLGASLLQVPLFILFGALGMLAFAHFGMTLIAPSYVAFLSLFFIVQAMPVFWQVLAVILAVMMVASSADTIQAGMTGLLSPIIDKTLDCCGVAKDKMKSSTSLALSLNFVVVLITNLPAIVLACQGISVLSLFCFADLLAATCVVPVILGLSPRIHPIAAFAGCMTGLLTTLIVYGVGVNGEAGNFAMLFAPGGLYAKTSLVAFCATPVASALVTLLLAFTVFKGYRFTGFEEMNAKAKAEADKSSKATTGTADVEISRSQA